jgi:hypothetical protein
MERRPANHRRLQSLAGYSTSELWVLTVVGIFLLSIGIFVGDKFLKRRSWLLYSGSSYHPIDDEFEWEVTEDREEVLVL